MAATTQSPTAVSAVTLYWLASEAENLSLKEENDKLKEIIKNLTRSHKAEIESLSTQIEEIKDKKDHYEECYNSIKKSCYDQLDIMEENQKDMDFLRQDMKRNKDRFESKLRSIVKENETENKKLMEIIVNSNQKRKELENLVKDLRNKLEIKMKSNNSDSTQDVKDDEL